MPKTASASRPCCKNSGLRQPENGIARSAEQAEEIADRIGYPIIIRPSYVLGGRAMEILYDRGGLARYMREITRANAEKTRC